MSAWHATKPTWSSADDSDIDFVVEHRLPDWGLTRLGRRIAARRLAERDAPVEEVADLIGIDQRTVYRWRAEERPAA